jgi:aminopyrrolnitrin oxygenase
LLAKSSIETRVAPAGERFSKYPAAWYVFCNTSELAEGPVSKEMFGRRLVAFRSASGQVAVLDARCAHLGADLGRGDIVGESIRCPYHHWRYGADGRCVHIPTGDEIPEFARQGTYPVEERLGYVFLFNSRKALFPLPFFEDSRIEDFIAGQLFRFEASCPWYLVAANGFDSAHYHAVHDRVLIGATTVDCPSPFAHRIRYRASITGDALADRLLRRFIGKTVDVTITSWGGPLFLVTATYRRARSYIIIITRPVDCGRTVTEVIPCAPRSHNAIGRTIWTPLSLQARRFLTREFMRKDFDRLDGLRYNPRTLVESDREMIEFFDWIASLPQTTHEGGPT